MAARSERIPPACEHPVCRICVLLRLNFSNDEEISPRVPVDYDIDMAGVCQSKPEAVPSIGPGYSGECDPTRIEPMHLGWDSETMGLRVIGTGRFLFYD